MQAHVQAQLSKGKKNNKPTPTGRLKKIYAEWAGANLKPNTKKAYYRDDIRSEWECSKEYGQWLDEFDKYGWKNEPAESQIIKRYSAVHTSLNIHIHQGNLPLNKKKH